MDYLKILSSRFNLREEWTRHGITVLKSSELYIQLIEPNHRTGFQYCLRADFPETFNRWALVLFEEEFLNDGGFLQALEALDTFISDKINIVKEKISKGVRLE
ncbi:hypothetical protein [Paenibacillus sp. 1781tsa1]|uniref:hypothetical protein n=1 Tax=Paenibacillus sp. 1781tsa1 TaxID=2953810 RepID=UPI00209F7F9A|nr:hypothetical protein [Paenibacillus sp. 1781tsa1]MCP1185044.1 hypothetical protein [Paenibacillus sp. 1781tsa1]